MVINLTEDQLKMSEDMRIINKATSFIFYLFGIFIIDLAITEILEPSHK